MKIMVHRHCTDKATLYREVFDSLVKIGFCWSLEIMGGSCYVIQIKIPFDIENYAFHLYSGKNYTFYLKRGDHNLQNQNIYEKMFKFLYQI